MEKRTGISLHGNVDISYVRVIIVLRIERSMHHIGVCRSEAPK